jgi:hypothetical protein
MQLRCSSGKKGLGDNPEKEMKATFNAFEPIRRSTFV